MPHHLETPQADSLPVLTIADTNRIMADRQYAQDTASRIVDFLVDLDNFRGTRRLDSKDLDLRVGLLDRGHDAAREPATPDLDDHGLDPAEILNDLGVAFVKKSTLTEGAAPTVLPPRHTSSTYEAPRMDIDSVRLEGPYNPTGRGDTPSRRQIFVCHPGRQQEEEPCARKILAAIAGRAYRRLFRSSYRQSYGPIAAPSLSVAGGSWPRSSASSKMSGRTP